MMRRTPLMLVALLLLTACAKAPTPAATPVTSPPVAVPVVTAPAPGATPAPAATPEPTPPPPPAKRQEWAPGTPEHAVQAYYAGYLRVRGLDDGTFRQSPYLAPEMIQSVEKRIASGADGSDPFLCAQNVAREILVDKAEISGPDATLWAYGGPWGDASWTNILIKLRQQDGQWQIRQVICHAR